MRLRRSLFGRASRHGVPATHKFAASPGVFQNKSGIVSDYSGISVVFTPNTTDSGEGWLCPSGHFFDPPILPALVSIERRNVKSLII